MLSWDLHAKQTRTLERVSLGSSFKITWLQPGTDECTSHWGTLRNIAHCLSVCLATLQSQDSQNSAHNLPPCEHSQMELSLLQFPGEQSWWWWVENNDWRWLGTTANSLDLYGTKRGVAWRPELSGWPGAVGSKHDVFEAQSLHLLTMLRQTQNLNHIRVWNKKVVNSVEGLFSRIIKSW